MSNIYEGSENDTLPFADNNVNINLFTASINLKGHPLIKSKRKIRVKYFMILDYFVNTIESNNIFIKARLGLYKQAILRNDIDILTSEKDIKTILKNIMNNPLKPWMKKYRYLLFWDLCLILVDEYYIQKILIMFEGFFNDKQLSLLAHAKSAWMSNNQFNLYPTLLGKIIKQCNDNRVHWRKKEARYMVSANMSAGKSTLINALVGKVVSGMKCQAFTAECHFIYDKPFEDNMSSEWDGVLTIDAGEQTLMDYDKRNLTEQIYVSTHYNSFVSNPNYRFCFIDTPGVNSSINSEHGNIAREMLRAGSFDKLIYVFNCNRMGTDEELLYLKFVFENVTQKKVLFLINKLDDFNIKEDSIEETIEKAKNDLLMIGYDNPKIYPISAYFSLLLKKRLSGVLLSEDEQDYFEQMSKKFKKKEFDLSKYYPCILDGDVPTDNEYIMPAKKCGLYGLEEILYGGMN